MKKLILATLLAISVAGLAAQESVTLTTPVAKTATATWRVSYLNLDVDNLRIVVFLTANNGDTLTKVYDATTTPTGATLLTSLNRGNFSVNSLIRAVYNRILTDGVIPAGSIAGTPQ